MEMIQREKRAGRQMVTTSNQNMVIQITYSHGNMSIYNSVWRMSRLTFLSVESNASMGIDWTLSLSVVLIVDRGIKSWVLQHYIT